MNADLRGIFDGFLGIAMFPDIEANPSKPVGFHIFLSLGALKPSVGYGGGKQGGLMI
jgi:hypothetical protein